MTSPPWPSIVSVVLSLGAFVFSIMTYVRAERIQRRFDARDFLIKSLATSSRLENLVFAFRVLPEKKGDFLKEWAPAVTELGQVANEGLRWRKAEWTTVFDEMCSKVAKLAKALAEMELRLLKDPSSIDEKVADQLAEDVDLTSQNALEGLRHYSTVARNALKEIF